MSTIISRLARRTSHSLVALAGGALLLGLLSACQPEPPDRERPPEPQAAQHFDLHDAIQEPIERARQVEVDLEHAAEAQRAAVDAASGG
ncbi:MAG: hypothetical protein M3Q42_09800 [Pseudomonadota bacterium]|nr:hypothetical protein [Pseudomonadota bacterium]